MRVIKKYDDLLMEQLQDEEFKREYENLKPELDEIRTIIDARLLQILTQKERSERTGIDKLI
ncbi:MAG: hypothetical protein PHG06_20520 [Parabacteroides sp.]|nr:hypothetical protein [Parabacteroides sp.]